MSSQKITAIMIIEAAGRPPEFLAESLNNHIQNLSKAKNVQLINSKIAESKIIDKEKDLFSCFAEVEVQVDGFHNLLNLVIDFMPSSIEIIEPNEFILDSQEATMFANDLAGRLHKYDEVAKIAKFRIDELVSKLQSQNSQKQNSSSTYQPIKVTMSGQAEKKKPAKVSSKIKNTKKKK
jgi:hypothetical protein